MKQHKPSLKNRKSTARIQAIQALYQMDLSTNSLENTLKNLENTPILDTEDNAQDGREDASSTVPQPDYGWVRHLVSGVVRKQSELDPAIHNILPQDWPLKRIHFTLRALLRCGAYELIFQQDIPAKVILNEYIDIADSFFDNNECNMVNGVLDTLNRQYRTHDVSDKATDNV